MKPGSIGWIDLTVKDAPRIRDFYREVTGWSPEPVAMDGYSDFNMSPPGGGDPVAGICHARGSNADLPPQWMIYIVVDDVERSRKSCEALGGEVLVEPRGTGARYCVIRDPAGAVCALYQPADPGP